MEGPAYIILGFILGGLVFGLARITIRGVHNLPWRRG